MRRQHTRVGSYCAIILTQLDNGLSLYWHLEPPARAHTGPDVDTSRGLLGAQGTGEPAEADGWSRSPEPALAEARARAACRVAGPA